MALSLLILLLHKNFSHLQFHTHDQSTWPPDCHILMGAYWTFNLKVLPLLYCSFPLHFLKKGFPIEFGMWLWTFKIKPWSITVIGRKCLRISHSRVFHAGGVMALCNSLDYFHNNLGKQYLSLELVVMLEHM